MSDLRRKICSLVIKSALLSPDEQMEEKFWGKFYFFWFFLDVQGTFFWFFRCIIRSLVVQTEFLKPRWTYPLGKKLWENFLSFPDYGRNFLNIHWSLLGMLSKLQFTCSQEHFEKGYFFEFFKIVFGLWAIIVQTSGEKFQQHFPNCILRVQGTSRVFLQ